MASLEEHRADCVEQLGEPFTQVHQWLDELQADYGPMHRPFRHQTEGVERVRSRWGDRAASAAESPGIFENPGDSPSLARRRARGPACPWRGA